MRRFNIFFLGVVPLAVTFFSLSGYREKTPISPMADVSANIPADSDIRGWQRDGETQVFKGEDLYLYIDGGADIYQEYGFEAVAVQDYKSPGGKTLSLEVFQMKDSAAAFGMYTFKRSAGGKAIDIGEQGQLEDYYLNFRKGSCVVTLTGFDEEEATIQGLLIVGRAADAKIKAGDEAPSLPRLLPEEGLDRQSVKYIRGQIGLNNIYSFFPRKVFSFDEAVKGDYGEGKRLLIMLLNDPRPPESWFADIGREFRTGDRYRNFRTPRPFFLQVDEDRGQTLSAAVFKKFLVIAFGTGQSPSEKLVELAVRRIESAGF